MLTMTMWRRVSENIQRKERQLKLQVLVLPLSVT